ncbi:HAD family acid phosphatase [Streptomyces sp. NPDC054887]
MRTGERRTRAAATATTLVLSVVTAVTVTAPAAAAQPQEPALQPRTASSARLLAVDYRTWQRDVAAVVATARPYLEQRTSQPSDERRAIVLDIDNTSLETAFHDFWDFPTPAVAPVRDLSRFADSRGVDVFFVTARPGIIHALTEYNLQKAGYPVAGLYARSLPDLFDEVSAYKTDMRAKIEARGYTIIANIGNNTSDLVGGHAEKTFKLPDYGGQLS